MGNIRYKGDNYTRYSTDTTIVPNPEGDATEQLIKLGIDGIIYGIFHYAELTSDQYDQLSEEEKNNGTAYFIKDK